MSNNGIKATTNIRTFEDLLEEKKRLQAHIAFQRQNIANDWQEMKTEFKPLRDILSFVGKFTSRDRTNTLVNLGLDLAADTMLRRVILGNAGWITKTVVPRLVKNFSSHILTREGRHEIAEQINEWFRKLKSHKKTKTSPES